MCQVDSEGIRFPACDEFPVIAAVFLRTLFQNLGSLLFFHTARPGFRFRFLCVETYQHYQGRFLT